MSLFRELALIYGAESVKGDHLPLIYVRCMLCSGFCCSGGVGAEVESRGSFWVGYESNGEAEAMAAGGQR